MTLLNVDIMVWVWIAVMAITLFVEMSTPVLVSIWFSLGALVAAGAAWLGLGLTAQLFLFVLVSVAALALARPMAKRWLDPHIVPTNADRLIGTSWKVTETIDNDDHMGAVYADGKTWTARSEDGSTIPAGESVEILRIEGVKLIVRISAESRASCGIS